MKMKRTFFFLMAVWSFMLVGCTDESTSQSTIVNPSPKEQWSETMKGNGEVLGAYPDLYSNYWEYTYNVNENPDVALCIKGQFPYARYFSFSLYNDETGTAIGGIDDYDIVPDEGCDNPFVVTSTKKNTFTVYIVPAIMDEAQIAKLPSKNICRIDKGVNRLAVCIRHYLGTDAEGESDEYGGVEMPAITGYDIHTLEEVKAPLRTASNINGFGGTFVPQKSDDYREVPFLLAPRGQYYPNNATNYLYGRTHLQTDSVLVFSFKPVTIPQRVEDYRNANARYWSICLGAASNTRSYYSLCDVNALSAPDKKSTFIVCQKQNPRLAEIEERVAEMNRAGALCNLFVWDKEKLDVDGNPIGDIIVIMYRNILPNEAWEYSISRMTPTNYADEEGEPLEKITDSEKQIAHIALGDYGPLGMKYSTKEFLEKDDIVE